MKKLLLALLLGCTFLHNPQAETLKNAIGVRGGGGSHFSYEVSYQHATKENKRWEFDLGYSSGGDGAGGLLIANHHWISPIERNFYWFVGCGAAAGYWSDNLNKSNGPILGATGTLGIEYRFKKIPFQIAFDTRPEGYFLYYSSQSFHVGGAFSIRYVFK